MTTALYALGGVLITLIANYLLENKKSKNQIALKSLELESTKKHDLLKLRRESYAKYLKKIDDFVLSRYVDEGEEAQKLDLALVMDDYYSSLILAGEETSYHINGVLEMSRKNPFDDGMFQNSKTKLLEAMKNELQ
ncbi:hypothetical protein [Shewanella frigidimarina]|uniref:hypothetical protein n=1 Tax=Shewanella frigidimarina TaxID=56812 RepID=UPI003D79C801